MFVLDELTVEGILMDALNHFCLVPAINHNRSALIDIDPVNPAISLIVSFRVFPQRLILLIRNIVLDFDNDESSHRGDAILRIFCSLLLRQALKPIALVGS